VGRELLIAVLVVGALLDLDVLEDLVGDGRVVAACCVVAAQVGDLT
jgi:hypothetical protein